MKLLFLFFFCSCCVFKLSAQTSTVSYYFDPRFNVTTHDSATYLAFAIKENDLWNASIINLTTKDTVVKGHYNDSLFSIPEGKFEIYSDNGVRQEEGNYKTGKKHGVWFTWNDNGLLTDSAYYENGEGIVRTEYLYDGDENLISAVHENKNLNESIRVEYESGKEIRELTNRLNDHSLETKIYYDNGQLKTDFIQKKGKAIKSKYYADNGTELSEKEYNKLNELPAVKMVEPEFPGGINVFMRYITDAFKRDNALRYETGTLKEVTIIFFLDKNGKPYNIKLSSPESTEITQDVINTMNTMPHWKMNGFTSFGPIYRSLRYIF